MDLTPNKQCLREESGDDVRRTASCCSDSNDDTDNDDSAGSARPTNIPQRIPLCLEPITTRDRVMRMEERVRTNFPNLKPTVQTESNGYVLLEITNKVMHYHSPVGYIHRIRVIVTPAANTGYHYNLQVMFSSISSGEIETDEDLFQVCEMLLRSNGFVFCPGISYDAYFNDFYPVIRFHCKPVNVMECPVKCVHSKSCKRWFKLPKNASREEQASNEVLCGACKRLNSILKYQKSKSSLVSPAKRQKRQAPNSNYPLKFLSPASVQKRKEKHSKSDLKPWHLRTNILNWM